ncbi:MAG: hypothetical protein HC789_17300 [Microcoleus sp. CSU_2_2]|nr:hypothetical protein [Microcoleus sp. SU_5_3]NJS12000.1 hypothetical protein [Microcoleus sp. CSU_2_2]
MIFCTSLRNGPESLFYQKLAQNGTTTDNSGVHPAVLDEYIYSGGLPAKRVNLKLCTIISLLEAEPPESG